MRYITLFIFSLFIALPLKANELDGHYSPYLAMHGNDPVKWMQWGQAALDKASKENKPLFISSGYFACHWCHVMHKESFKNPEIAKLLNEHYVPVKIDREISPVLDQRLIHFVQITTRSAGWPLNVFMTPEGYPMVGATYIPPEDFTIALERLQGRWQSEQEQLKQDAKTTNDKIAQKDDQSQQKGKQTKVADNKAALKKASLKNANEMQGGFGHQSQFPREPALLSLLRLSQETQDKNIDEFLTFTLDQIQSQGLHDLIGGGFYRYTVDPAWEVPHFEKMLYNNAMLPVIFAQAAEHYQRPDYAATAQSTLDFLQAEMKHPSGAYYASLSAVDDKDIEGGYYLWQQEDLKKILTEEEIKLANQAWGLDQPSELEAGSLPREQGKDIDQEKLTLIKNKLKDWRVKNRKLPKDTKLLAAWNGLTLAAFASLPDKAENQQAAKQLGQFLQTLVDSNADSKQLRRSKNSQQAGTLNDYASVAYGLIHWGKAANDQEALQQGTAIAELAWQKFHTDKGWRQTETSLLPNPIFQTHIADSALPSPESLLLEASLLSGNKALQEKAQQVLAQSTRDIEDDPFAYASLITLPN